MSKRYVVLTVGYQSVALPYSSGAELAALVSSISEAKQVNSVGYGDEQKYVPATEEPVQFLLVDAARVTIGDELATLKAKLEEQTREAKMNNDRWMTYYTKANDLEKKLKELQTPAAAPTPPPPPPPQPEDDFPI